MLFNHRMRLFVTIQNGRRCTMIQQELHHRHIAVQSKMNQWNIF